ncbi:MAG: YraN family protein [Clostridia bacterium]|nr:YraN family protein [Clostridia bacterium]
MRARGDAGEGAVCSFLEGHGAKILCRNYKAAHGELDIIAESEHYLLFVEVKRRAAHTDEKRFGRPAAAVSERKKQHLISAAEEWIYKQGEDISPKPMRLDVAEVMLSDDDPPEILHINYIPGAFVKS